MAATEALVRSERRGRTLLVTIANPPVNVLSRPVLESLAAKLDEAEADLDVHAVVLASAAPTAFAAGADLREMASLDPAGARKHGGRGQELTRKIERLPLPVIAAVHGACLGGGCEVALACDLIVASEDARFGQPEIGLGVMPGWGGTRRLPRRIGAARARRWILTGRPVAASEALAAGLVDRVVPREELLSSALAVAAELSSKPPVALAAAKYALLNAIDPERDRGLAFELDLWSRLFGTHDQRQGMAAFLDKRPAPETTRRDWAEESRGFPWVARPPRPRARKRKRRRASGLR